MKLLDFMRAQRRKAVEQMPEAAVASIRHTTWLYRTYNAKGGNVYAETVKAHVVDRRRAKNKVARASRRKNRR